MPVAKVPGDSLIGGTVNAGGPLRMRVARVGADTALAQIVRLVEAAQVGSLIDQSIDKPTNHFTKQITKHCGWWRPRRRVGWCGMTR